MKTVKIVLLIYLSLFLTQISVVLLSINYHLWFSAGFGVLLIIFNAIFFFYQGLHKDIK